MSSESWFFKSLTKEERDVVLKNTTRFFANEDFFPSYELQSASQLGQYYQQKKNFAKAIEFFEKALRLYHENFPLKHFVNEETTKEFNDSAKRLYYETMFELAKSYSLSDKPNHQKAAEYLKKAADEYDDADAQNALACMYLEGQGVPQDMAKAAEYLEKAAVQGNMYAQTTLGRMYEAGAIGHDKDPDTALYWYKRAAEQGDDLATENLMRLQGADIDYMGSYEIPGTNVKPADIVNKIKAKAEQGDFEKQCILASCYLNGGFVLRDVKKGIELLTKYADEGNPFAQYELGACYDSGQFVKQDKKKAFQYFLRAAHQGVVSAKYNVGRAYYSGTGIGKNVSKSFQWLLSAAEDGHPDAQYIIAFYYDKGIGCEHDYSKMIYWLKQAADRGHYTAQVQLLQEYEELYPYPNISGDEFKYWRERIKNNNPDNKGYSQPIVKLGSIPDIKNPFRDKQNKPARDIRRFEDNLKKALKGNMYNMYVVGECYQNGVGVEQNVEEAMTWFKRAADLGFRKAQEKLNAQSE